MLGFGVHVFGILCGSGTRGCDTAIRLHRTGGVGFPVVGRSIHAHCGYWGHVGVGFQLFVDLSVWHRGSEFRVARAQLVGPATAVTHQLPLRL